MRKSIKNIISIILSVAMVFSLCSAAFAKDVKNISEFTYDISVSERNGIELKNHMVKRGIPLTEGIVFPGDNFVVVDKATKEEIPVFTKALEKHEDKSVSWLLVSFFLDLEANEKRDFTLKRVEETPFQGADITVNETQNGIAVSNGILSITVDKGGLNSIIYKSAELLSGNGTNTFYSLQGKERINSVGTKVEVYENTPNYVTIKSTSMSNGGMTFEQLYTVYRNSNRIGNQHRATLTDGELSGYIFVDSIGQEFELTNDFDSFTHGGPDSIKLSDSVTLSRSNSVSAYSENKNITIGIVSRDVNKFAGVAGNLGVVNGFATDSENKTLTFSPLVYRTGGKAFYKWYDGIGRTFHSDIIISDGNNTVNYENEFINIDNPPYVHVQPQKFVDTGWIGTTETMSVIERNFNTLVDMYSDVRLGRLDTGSLTYESADNGMIKGVAQRPAKIEYHSWIDQMHHDSADYYDIIAESCETYADICIYRGANSLERGAGRYRNYFNDQMQFENWQCYYTTPDGMYLGYLMTGNEYLKDTIKLHYDYAYAVSLIAKEKIKNTPQKYGKALLEKGKFEEPKPIEDGFQIHGETLLYTDDDEIKVISNTATRFAVHVRSAYFVYRLFEDEKYLGITKGYIDWLDYYQMDNGRIASSYYFDGSPGFFKNDENLIVTSNYILLYGLRAVNDVFRMTDETDKMYDIVDRNKMRKVLIGLADWLIEDSTPAGDSWAMSDPDTADIEGNRELSAGILAYGAEILYTAYNETKDIKYLEAFCKMRLADMAAIQEDGFPGEVHSEPYKHAQMGTFYIPFIRENEELIKELGYNDLVDLYLYGGDLVVDEFKALNPNTPVIGSIWESDKNRTIYMYYSNKGADKDYIANINTGDKYIYEGTSQIITPENNTVLTPSFMPLDNVLGRDKYRVKRTDLKVISSTSDVKAEIIKNTDEEVSVMLQAEKGKINLALCSEDEDYGIDVKYQSYRNSKILTFKKGGNNSPLSGEIRVEVDFTDCNENFILPDVVIDERVAPIVPVVSTEEGFRPAWTPYSPIEASHILKSTGEKASFTFIAKPLYNKYDTKIAHFSNENNVTGNTDFQFEFVFDTKGKIYAMNGDSHKSVDEIYYELGKDYEFSVEVDVPNRKYSAFVTGPDKKTYTLAKDYSFRTTSKDATTIDGIVVNGKPNSMVVKNHSLKK